MIGADCVAVLVVFNVSVPTDEAPSVSAVELKTLAAPLVLSMRFPPKLLPVLFRVILPPPVLVSVVAPLVVTLPP